MYFYRYVYVFLLYIYVSSFMPAGTLRLPWLTFFRAFSSVVRQMPGYNPQRRGTASTLPKFLCCSVYCVCVNVYCTAVTGWLPNCSLTNISYNISLGHVRLTVAAVKSNKYNIFWVCVCILALVIQLPKRMRPITLPPVACPAVPYFSTLYHKR